MGMQLTLTASDKNGHALGVARIQGESQWEISVLRPGAHARLKEAHGKDIYIFANWNYEYPYKGDAVVHYGV